ncbi:MAG: cytochrome P450 [Cyclobacteriaceae bacterium]|nr:cytochrome P450 [Cyclobacteriaceae bacterium]
MESPWKPYLKENILDPYPMYKALRDYEPIHRARTGEWVVTEYEAARSILKDSRFLVGNRAAWLEKASTQHLDKWESFSVIVDALKSFVVFKNPPDHTLLRKFIMQAWNNREVDAIIKGNIDAIFNTLDPTRFDLATELAAPLPAMTMTKILGLPIEDYKYLENLSHEMIHSLDLYLTFRQIERMKNATEEFAAYFEKFAADKLKNPDDSLLSRLVHLNKDQQIPHHELMGNCFFLFIAGEETTAGLIELGLYHLILNEELNKSFQEQKIPSLATEELLRFDSPAQIVVRIASEECEIARHKFEKEAAVTICLGAANRDPGKFERPDELILDRTPNHHLAFASGIHRCLGDWLAKREFEILLDELTTRFNRFELLSQPVWKENLNMRSLRSLYISCR